ncbi:hypothetical protein Back11_28760 [Paenibacillus baekrokdamisoli]|uniref:Uncharacterized protein n=1 Tax=Paenibacillus baekrokdamisoli TaxID=1712516 RepID=A0A3G9J6Z7_9BACL|nr:bifunctional diguanylate cyclase/phosphodiesterase [Paenibacillus baekrokdamisoli]MBB3071113.1 diguanylate cyclase (GGDEF)-like protein/PAS domain S-box-containing protein [Paenibacillus baekrokdamisoli]BBH21531.1 hypothetical protein Back11_28760 [Paenibacillus baekrokdamisoli]
MSSDAGRTPRQLVQQTNVSASISWASTTLLSLTALVWAVTGHRWLSYSQYWWSTTIFTSIAILYIIVIHIPIILRNQGHAHHSLHTPIVESILKHSPVALAVISPSGKFIEVNESSSQLLGYERDELVGRSFLPLIASDNRQDYFQRFQKDLLTYPQDASINVIHRTGYRFGINIITAPLTVRGESIGAIVFSHDISDHNRNIERIRYMAYYDDMTGLPNRRLFMMQFTERLTSKSERDNRIAIIYLDLDRFKLINASFGREFGDMLLMQVAERLTRNLTDQDVAARMDGDEFAIMYGDAGGELELLGKVKELLISLEEPFELQGFPLHVTASIGIAWNKLKNDDASLLMKKAEMALAKVKESGKNNCLLYSDTWENSSLERLKLQHDLKQALSKGEFVLHYQPQYNLCNGNMVGVEALIRWQHPERGLVPPNQFIPLAEESGMIVQIGDWVLQEACRQNKAWQDEGLTSIPVSVNLSIRQFLQQNLTDKVSQILKDTGLQAKYLDLEITESMTMDIERASRCLLELTSLGVNISMDDFGTGYSSFNYLKSLPIGRLKIDRSFVRDIEQEAGDAAIVAAIISMGHNLNLQVIAEGVENEAQMQFLKKHHCDEIQGYFWSPPVRGQQIAEMLQGVWKH